MTSLVAENVKALRKQRAWTLEELSTRLSDAHWAISVPALSKLERGDRRIDVDDLVGIAAVFGVEASRLLTDDRAYLLGMGFTAEIHEGAAEDFNRVERALEFRERVRGLLDELGD